MSGGGGRAGGNAGPPGRMLASNDLCPTGRRRQHMDLSSTWSRRKLWIQGCSEGVAGCVARVFFWIHNRVKSQPEAPLRSGLSA